MATTKGDVVIAGLLFKKSDVGFKGFKHWNKRHFIVTTTTITIHKSEGEPAESQVRLLDVRSVEGLPERRLGDRFNITLKNGTVYALHSASREETVIWTNAIGRALNNAKQEEKKDHIKQNILDDESRRGKKFTGLQRMFFDARFGESKMNASHGKETFRETQAILTEIDRDFSTEADVIQFLLLRLMAPSLNICSYNRDEVKETKEDLTINSTVGEVLTAVGVNLNLKMDEYIKIFEDHTMFDVRDAIEAAIPSAIPRRIADKIEEAFEEIKTQAKRSPVLEMKPLATSNSPAPQERLLAMVMSPGMIRNLVVVFSSSDVSAHGLALRLLWAVFHASLPRSKAVIEFTSHVLVQCSGPRLSQPTKDALFALLLEGHEAISDLRDHAHLQFNRPIGCISALKPLLLSLKECHLEIRKEAVTDVTALVHENHANCELMVTGNDWQNWMLPLLTDLPNDRLKDEPVKSCFLFVVNIFTLVHFSFFHFSVRFGQVLNATVQRVHQFGGSNFETQTFISVLLSTLVNKLTAQSRHFSSDFESSTWWNLPILLAIVRKFVFQSSYLQSLPYIGLIRDDDEEYDDDETYDEDEFVLRRKPPPKNDRRWTSDANDIKDFGVHWAPYPDGACLGTGLAQKVCTMMQKLGVVDFREELLHGKGKMDKAVLLSLKAEAEFWEDAARFLDQIRREDISKRHIYTYRRLSVLCQTFTAESKSGREAVLKTLARLQAGEEETGQRSANQSSRELISQKSRRDLSLPRKEEREESSCSSLSNSPPSSSSSGAETGGQSFRTPLGFSTPSHRRAQSGGNLPSVVKHASVPLGGRMERRGDGNSSGSLTGSLSGSSCSSGTSSGSYDLPQDLPPIRPGSPRSMASGVALKGKPVILREGSRKDLTREPSGGNSSMSKPVLKTTGDKKTLLLDTLSADLEEG